MPFAVTALLDLTGSKIPQGSRGEGLVHFGAVRMRVTGSGNLKSTIYSQDEVRAVTVAPIAMEETTDKQPTRPTSLIAERAMYKIYTDMKDEVFFIQRIIIYSKPIYSGYPE